MNPKLTRQTLEWRGEFVAELGGLGAAFVLGLDHVRRSLGQELLIGQLLVDLGDLTRLGLF